MRHLDHSLADHRLPCLVLVFNAPDHFDVPTPLPGRAAGNTNLEAFGYVVDAGFAFSSFTAFGES